MSAPPAGMSDLVRDSQLRTTITAGLTHHSYYVSSPESRRRRTRIEETWRRGRELGNGTFGRVWLEACEAGPKSGQLRALKEIAKDQTRSSSIDYGRELEAIAKFSHDNYVHCFVRSFGWYESPHAVFIAMEYFEHGDLQKHLVLPFSESTTKEITAQIAEGLLFMHDNNFAHRDLKPANILVVRKQPDWWVKIGDFGISKRADAGSALRTLVGTPGYLAPELIGIFPLSEPRHSEKEREQLSYTASIDIWALGEMAVRMLTQRSAFPDRRDLFDYVVRESPFPRRVLDGLDVERECYDFIQRAMGSSPEKRLKAIEAVSHPWLKDSRPSSRASSRQSNMFVDTSSIPPQSSLVGDFQTGNIETLESAKWSTLDQLEALPSPATAEPLLTSTNISVATENLPLPEITASDIHSIVTATSQLKTAYSDSAQDASADDQEELAAVNLDNHSAKINYRVYQRGDRRIPSLSPLHSLQTNLVHEYNQVKSPDSNQPNQLPEVRHFHGTPMPVQVTSPIQISPVSIPQDLPERGGALLHASGSPSTVQNGRVSPWRPETPHSREGSRSVPPSPAEGQNRPKQSPQTQPGIFYDTRNRSPPEALLVSKTTIPGRTTTSEFRSLQEASTISDAELLTMRKVRADLSDLAQVDTEEVAELIQACTVALKARALDNPFFLLPFRPSVVTPTAGRQLIGRYVLISRYFSESPLRGKKLREELEMMDPLIVATILKWCWARIPGGVVGWDIFRLFETTEKRLNMATNSFATFLQVSVQSNAKRSIIFHFFDLLSATAANVKVNGLSGVKLSRMAGWWAFELDETSRTFMEGYKSWLKASDATFHLFFAYLRAQNLDHLKSYVPATPVALQNLLNSNNYPPDSGSCMRLLVRRFLIGVHSPAFKPIDILQRTISRADEFSSSHNWVLQKLSEQTGPTTGLSDESERVLKAISDSQNTVSDSVLYPSGFWSTGVSGSYTTDTDHSSEAEIDLDLAEIIGPLGVDEIGLNDAFWWVWMQSLAPEETLARKQIFGHTVIAETTFAGHWVICEESVQEQPEPVKLISRPKVNRGFGRLSRVFKVVGK